MRATGRRSYLLVMVASVAVAAAVLGGPREARADGPLAQPAHMNVGDLIIDLGIVYGEENLGEDSDGVDILAPAGAYKGTLRLEGVLGSPDLAFEYSGNILHRDGDAFSRFGHSGGSGTLVVPPDEVNYPIVSAYALDVPENIYATVYVDSENVIWKYPRDGTGYGSPTVVAADPWENETYVMSLIGLSGCTLVYGGIDVIKRYDICTQTQLADFAVGLPNATDKTRVLLDGSVLAVEPSLIRHLHADGSSETFTDANSCLTAADAYETTLYTVDVCNSRILSWDLATGDLIGVVKQYTAGEIADRGDAYPIGVRVYNRVAPPKPVIFVHGVKEDGGQTSTSFADLMNAMSLPTGALTRAKYFQDATTECPDSEPSITSGSTIETTFWAGTGYFDDCDSQSDVGKSAVNLHALVAETYAASGGQRAILIGYSQGAATIRGMLSYSQELGDGVAETMVDSAIFLEGVQHGTLVANAVLAGHEASGFGYQPWNLAGTIRQRAYDTLVDLLGDFEFGRPAIHQLAVNSEWMRWSADPDKPLPNIGYYNAYGDMRVTDKSCVNFKIWGGCYTATLLTLGDIAIQPGLTDSPYYVQLPVVGNVWGGGGARFSRPDTTEQWQWDLRHDFDIKKWKLAIPGFAAVGAGLEVARFVSFMIGAPEQHLNIGNHTGDIHVEGCAGEEDPITLKAQIASIVRGKMGAEVYACPLHE